MDSNLARIGLRLNAAFSLATGTLLTAAPSTVGGWLNVSIHGWLRALGIALIGHGFVLGWVAGRERLEPWLKLNLAMIAPYPLAMLGLALTGLVDRPLGQLLVILDGVIVGAFALMQWRGLSREPAPRPTVDLAS